MTDDGRARKGIDLQFIGHRAPSGKVSVRSRTVGSMKTAFAATPVRYRCAWLLTVKPGDHIVTKTIDSAGFDFTGVGRTATHGNPLTGPFFVKGAEPGDALEVRIDRIRLNRTTGYTGYQVGLKETPAVEKPGSGSV